MTDGHVLSIADMLKTIERYNPEHLTAIENHVREQAKDNNYDLEANLAVLKLYQFNPHLLNLEVTNLILLKALTNFPHTDFTLCKCLLLPTQVTDETVQEIIFLADILEKCDFELFWAKILRSPELVINVNGFYDSIRKYVCHVVSITFQTIAKDYLARLLGEINDQTLNTWIKKYGWKDLGNNLVYISSQDDKIKTKNITEKIEFDNLSQIMTSCI